MNIREELISRAMEDPGFRARLKSDPRGTLERELGLPVPADTEITVLEQSRRHAYVVLPVKAELSEEELAGAAGGSDAFSALDITYGKGC